MADFVVAGVDSVTEGNPTFVREVGDRASRINGSITSGPTTSVYFGSRLETSNGDAKPAGGNLGVCNFGGSHSNSAPHHGHRSRGTANLMEDVSDHRNVYRTYKEYIGFGNVNREGVQETFNVRDQATNTNIEGVPDHAGGQKMLLNTVTGGDEAERTETIESFESEGSQTFHDDGPRNNGEIHIYEHPTGHGRDPDLYVHPSHDHLNVPPSHDQLHEPSVGTDETKWVVTDALANVRGAGSVNKPQILRGTPSLTSIHITQIKVMPRPPSRVGSREDHGPSRVGSREDGGKRKRTQNTNHQDTEPDITIKKDGELRDDAIKGNGFEVDGTNCKQGQSVKSLMGDTFDLGQKDMDSQLLDKKEQNGNEDVSQNINIAQQFSLAVVTTPSPTKTPGADVTSSTLGKKNQVTNKMIRAASCVPCSLSVSKKPRPKTSSLKSSARVPCDVRHLSATALHINQDVYNAYARATPPRGPLSRQNSLPGPGQHKPFISIYDRPFSRRELRQALPRKSFFSCHDKALKEVELPVTDSPIRSKPGQRKTQLDYQAGESAQSFLKVADHTPEIGSQQISTCLEESKTRTSLERSNDVNASKEATGTPATDSDDITANGSKEVFHVGESEVFKSPTPIFQKRKPQSAKSGGVACTPLTEYLEYVKENRQEFLKYQESLKRESPANTRLIKLGQVYALRHQGGVARRGCDDVLVLAAKTLRPRSEQVNRQKEPVVRSAGSYRKPSRMNLDDRRPREKMPAPGAAVREDEFGKSELERRKARAEEWAWSISSHKLAKAKLESLRELGSEDRELTAWWEEFKDCQYLRTVHA
ncbi:unnamed protein product [Lymnaea stagnalis]|uniref:Uncharacterized protein n=1 Tax=Lymnaea stagnalis TaxID=6523 RepID=A0AAV2HQ84_LYMST